MYANAVRDATNGRTWADPSGTTVNCEYDVKFYDGNDERAKGPEANSRNILVYNDALVDRKPQHGINIGGVLVTLKPNYSHLGSISGNVHQGPRVMSNLNGFRFPMSGEADVAEILRNAQMNNEKGKAVFRDFMRSIFMPVGMATKPYHTSGHTDEVNDDPIALIYGKLTVRNFDTESWECGDRLYIDFPLPDEDLPFDKGGDSTVGDTPTMRPPILRKYRQNMNITDHSVRETFQCPYPPLDGKEVREPVELPGDKFMEEALMRFVQQIHFFSMLDGGSSVERAYEGVFVNPSAAFLRKMQKAICCSAKGLTEEMYGQVNALPMLLNAMARNYAADQNYVVADVYHHCQPGGHADIFYGSKRF